MAKPPPKASSKAGAKARPRAAAPPPGAGGRKAGGGWAKGILLIAVVIILLPVFLPTVLVLAFGMLPTFVAVIVDRGPKRYGGITVGGLNFSGAAPYVLDLWTKGHTTEHALNILTDVLALMVIYGASAFGWMLYSATPTLVATFITLTSSRRLATLQAKQAELVTEWGQEVGQQEEVVEIGAARPAPEQ